MSPALERYEESVYAGVLGKVIGVYVGRPFEGWTKEKLQERFGRINRYVHEDLGKPLVVSDDDISGTLAFVRILEDSGLYADTPVERFGDNWLNYLVENRTVLWWGGMGVSTEHTAFMRLKQGMKAPASGSIATNGAMVAEQIGAQIFIDAFGLAAPGRPELAVALARKAASVSHDGEALYGALVVAAMVSAAFVEKDMEKLLDLGVSFVPADSLIAQVHRDVRAWCREDGNWHKTYDRIKDKYGYDKFLGNCHMIPNHAIMVMAWAYAPNDFRLSQEIINSAGWDTDCNAANVGCVMGVKLGLAGINAGYDFQGPFADRIIWPTAEGTRHVTDCLEEALHVARIGRRVMGWEELPPPKDNAFHHFSLPGALHGYMADTLGNDARAAVTLTNPDGAGMRVSVRELCDGRLARISTPLQHYSQEKGGGYSIMGTPRLYSGYSVVANGICQNVDPGVAICLFVRRVTSDEGDTELLRSQPLKLATDQTFNLKLVLPDNEGRPFLDLGFELTGTNRASASLQVDAVRYNGMPTVTWHRHRFNDGREIPVGWISSMDDRSGSVFRHRNDVDFYCKNSGRGMLVTGTTDWEDYAFECDLAMPMPVNGGICVRYQGLRRYMALVKTPTSLKFVKVCYEETTLAEVPMVWDDPKALHTLKIVCLGERYKAFCDDQRIFDVRDPDGLTCGGAGLLVDDGVIGFREMSITPA